MTFSILKGEKVDAKVWVPNLYEVESGALTQLRKISALPWIAHLAVMPDVHLGAGATVGSVIAMRQAVSPAAVGVDIGCGMGAIRTNLHASNLPNDLSKLRLAIEAAIPSGFNGHDKIVSPDAHKLQNDINTLWDEFDLLDENVHSLRRKAGLQLGTLGGGNHFIELCLDNGKCWTCDGEGVLDMGAGFLKCEDCNGLGIVDPIVWMMLHSGSRNIGKELATIHMNRAKDLKHNVGLPDKDLAVFLAGTPEMEAYRHDLFWAQRYAFLNRRVMFELYKNVMKQFFPHVTFDDPILCHHNYVSEEIHFGEGLIVTRKGAISAKKGELGIIPGSMGAKSFIVEGLGNEDSLHSASHGAGRRMSRGEAKRTFTQADLEAQTAGVECRKDSGVIDEIPGAYKDIDQVMENQRTLVKSRAELKQVLCVKGN